MTNNNTGSPSKVYTDGSSDSRDRSGGWAFIAEHYGETIIESGQEVDTTNNRMELTAVIEGIAAVADAGHITVYSDSRYVLDGIQQWIFKWRQRNYTGSSGDPVKNRDLWERLYQLVYVDLDGTAFGWKWVKGHSGHEMNGHADELANMARKGQPQSWRGLSIQEYLGVNRTKQSGSIILGRKKLVGIDLHGLDLSGASFIDVDMSMSDLSGCNLTGTRFIGVSLRGANLEDATFDHAAIISVDFQGATLERTDFSKAKIRLIDLGNANLAGIKLPEDAEGIIW